MYIMPTSSDRIFSGKKQLLGLRKQQRTSNQLQSHMTSKFKNSLTLLVAYSHAKTAVMVKREKQRTSNLLQSYVTRRFKNYLKIIVQHIALKEEKREQQSLLDQLDTHTKKKKKKKDIIEFIISLRLLNRY